MVAAGDGADAGWVETARGRCDTGGLAALWDQVPQPMRLSVLSAATVPADYLGAFCAGDTFRAGIDLSGLSESMRREVIWCVWRVIGLGEKIATPALGMLARRLGEVLADHVGERLSSLLDLPETVWLQRFSRGWYRRNGRLPSAVTTQHIRNLLTRMMRLLVTALDTRPWWERDRWDPVEETRIPLREHEPLGRCAVRFDGIVTGWLRRGIKWHCKVGLDTGMITWSTVHRRISAIKTLDAFIAQRQVPGPYLAEDAAGVRALMLEFLGELRSRPSSHGKRAGQPLTAQSVQRTVGDLEGFYRFMADYKGEAAAALSEPRWCRLGPEHTRFYRRGELPRKPSRRIESQIIEADAMSRIMAGLGLLGQPTGKGGFGDEQAMRITMLVALLGRRVSEICLLDPDPLLPLAPNRPVGDEAGEQDRRQAPMAKLRYQQTKIDGAPDTILVTSEVVAIIEAQQQWAERHFAARGAPGKKPKYLFLAEAKNRNGDRPYASVRLHQVLTRLAERLDIRDSTGKLVDFNRTHRFRHTKATDLLNSGVPLHVVQRYFGHLTPTMTMVYAETLQSTAEAEFLRYRKIGADARDVDIDPQDLYDMLELDRRSDRILPNGWCLLPPRQVCGKGNACLTCDKFATDASFLPELREQQDRTGSLIGNRRAAFTARTGRQMGEDNIWLAGRRQEQDALGRIIDTLETTEDRDGGPQAVRGAGVAARTDAITGNKGDER